MNTKLMELLEGKTLAPCATMGNRVEIEETDFWQ